MKRAVIVGAVESTRVAARAVAAHPEWELAAVVTLPLELAGRHSDFVDLAPEVGGARLIRARDGNAPEVLAALAELAPAQVFVVGWSQICRPDFIAAAGGRVVGYHPAPLPRLRGRGVIPWTILLGEPITAASVFWIDEGVDSGPLLAQRFFHVAPDETAATLYTRHMTALGELMPELLDRLAAGDAPGAPQDERFATWAARRTPDDGRVDWNRPIAAIERLVRAVGRPYPGAFTTVAGERLTLWSARPWAEGGRHAASPGQVVTVGDGGFAVMCGDGGTLWIDEWDGPTPKQHTRMGAAT